MQREIIFRGKRTDNEEWVYGSFIPDLLEVYTKEPDGEWGGDWGFIKPFGRTKEERMMVEVYRNTVGQFTGLLDRNGKRIFEGDIIECENYHGTVYGVVKWFDSCFYLSCYNGFSDEFLRNCSEFIVIGNEFENPEILEVQN